MVVEQSSQEALSRRTEYLAPSPFIGFNSEYFPTPAPDSPAPVQVRLSEQRAGTSLQAHFHTRQQFQVVVAGDGLFGRNPVKPYSIQFASTESAYGPIVAGPNGLTYMVLRPQYEAGGYMMPEGRKWMRPGLPKRQVTVKDVDALSDAALLALSAAECKVLLEPGEDGLAVWDVRLPPGSELPAVGVQAGLGRYYVVIKGALSSNSNPVLGPHSVVWASTGDNVRLLAAEGGAEVLVFQYPHEGPEVRFPRE